MIELIFLTLVLLTFFNFFILKDLAYPPFIFSLIWSFVLFVYIILSITNFLPLFTISDHALFIFLVGNIFFSIGGLVFVLYYKSRNNQFSEIERIEINYYFDNILFYGILILSPVFFYKAIQVSSETGISNFFIGLRYGLSDSDNNGYGLFKYLIPIAIFNSYYRFQLYQYRNEDFHFRLKFYISFILTIFILVLATGRSNIMLLILVLGSFKLISNKISLKNILNLSIFFFAVFFIFAVILGKGGSIESDLTENFSSVIKMFFWYMVGGLNAFDYFLQNQIHFTDGNFVFRFFYALGYKLGFSSTPPLELVQPFLFLPLPTNVYTIYYTYIQDFGLLITPFFLLAFSFLHTFFFFKARHGSESHRFFYALLMYPLIISFFQDQYFSLFSTWIQYTFFYFVTYRIFVKITYKLKTSKFK